MKEITAYQCDHCGKVFALKQSAKRHEAKCYHNPENKACRSCLYCNHDDEIGGIWCNFDDGIVELSATKEHGPRFKANCPKWKAKEEE